jgi:hypothetical protein
MRTKSGPCSLCSPAKCLRRDVTSHMLGAAGSAARPVVICLLQSDAELPVASNEVLLLADLNNLLRLLGVQEVHKADTPALSRLLVHHGLETPQEM